MKRLIEEKLFEWKNFLNRKPLLIYGARQIGKTYSMLEFGKEHYANVVYCNFENTMDLHTIFERNLDPERIISALSAMYNTEISKGNTLIIFDEIQACERALTSLKYFQEQANDYHIVAAGSLLGLSINRSSYSFPVGKVDMLTMYPLTFEEFLLATGNKRLISLIKEAYNNFSPFALHEKAMDLYRTYLIVGGYPAAVQKYIDTGDFNVVRAEQGSLSNAYIADMAKDYETSLAWLKSANVVLYCQRVSEGKYPLSLYEDHTSFKAYYSDVGLLTMRMSIAPNVILEPYNLSDKMRGMMAESFVAEQLVANGFSLHYWTSGNSAEIDFVIQKDGYTINSAEIDFVIQKDGYTIPLEVKSSYNVKAKSLQTYIKKYSPECSIRISSKNFGNENGIISIPLYVIFCLKDENKWN